MLLLRWLVWGQPCYVHLLCQSCPTVPLVGFCSWQLLLPSCPWVLLDLPCPWHLRLVLPCPWQLLLQPSPQVPKGQAFPQAPIGWGSPKVSK